MNILHKQFSLLQTSLEITDTNYQYPEHLSEKATQIWEDLNAQHTIWNGIIYRLMKLSSDGKKLTFILGLTDYKATQTASRMKEEFASIPFDKRPNAMYVSGPLITQDKYYVFSQKNSASIQTHSINFIGGSLNKDELVLTEAQDLAETCKKELKEELNIPASDVSIKKGLGIVETDSFRIAVVFSMEYLHTWEYLIKDVVLNNEHSKLIHVHADKLDTFLEDQRDLLNPLIPAILSIK